MKAIKNYILLVITLYATVEIIVPFAFHKIFIIALVGFIATMLGLSFSLVFFLEGRDGDLQSEVHSILEKFGLTTEREIV